MSSASQNPDRPAARLAAFERMLALLERQSMSGAADPRIDGHALALLVELATADSDPPEAT